MANRLLPSLAVWVACAILAAGGIPGPGACAQSVPVEGSETEPELEPPGVELERVRHAAEAWAEKRLASSRRDGQGSAEIWIAKGHLLVDAGEVEKAREFMLQRLADPKLALPSEDAGLGTLVGRVEGPLWWRWLRRLIASPWIWLPVGGVVLFASAIGFYRRHRKRKASSLEVLISSMKSDFGGVTETQLADGISTALQRCGQASDRTIMRLITGPEEPETLPAIITNPPAKLHWILSILVWLAAWFRVRPLELRGSLSSLQSLGPVLTLSLLRGRRVIGSKTISFHEVPGADAGGKSGARCLIEAGAVWVQFQCAALRPEYASKPYRLLETRRWRAYAFLRMSVVAVQHGEPKLARAFGAQAVREDRDFFAARINRAVLWYSDDEAFALAHLEEILRPSAAQPLVCKKDLGEVLDALRTLLAKEPSQGEGSRSGADATKPSAPKSRERLQLEARGWYNVAAMSLNQQASKGLKIVGSSEEDRVLITTADNALQELVGVLRTLQEGLGGGDISAGSPDGDSVRRFVLDFAEAALPVAAGVRAFLGAPIDEELAEMDRRATAAPSQYFLFSLACTRSLAVSISRENPRQRRERLDEILKPLQRSVWLNPAFRAVAEKEPFFAWIRKSWRCRRRFRKALASAPGD